MKNKARKKIINKRFRKISSNIQNYTFLRKESIYNNIYRFIFNFFKIIILSLFIIIITRKKKPIIIKQNYKSQFIDTIHLNISSLNYTEFNVTTSNNKRNKNKNGFEYFCCFCSMGKQENRYVRELIRYYMSIGIEKFVFGDNNNPNSEQLADVLQDYINNGTVDIIDIIGKTVPQGTFFGIMYERYKTKCEWLTFFDFDEYLVMHFDDKRNITINEYVSNPIFNNCDSILINWLIYGDNDLVYYDNRTSIERFTRPLFSYGANIFIKSMVRGNLTEAVFRPLKTNHHPNEKLKNCDSTGEQIIALSDTISPPNFKYAYLMHFNTRTAEEFAQKILKGLCGHGKFNIEEKVSSFFKINKLTEEKLKVLEKSLNKKFYAYH